jgi:hypothetical protein
LAWRLLFQYQTVGNPGGSWKNIMWSLDTPLAQLFLKLLRRHGVLFEGSPDQLFSVLPGNIEVTYCKGPREAVASIDLKIKDGQARGEACQVQYAHELLQILKTHEDRTREVVKVERVSALNGDAKRLNRNIVYRRRYNKLNHLPPAIRIKEGDSIYCFHYMFDHAQVALRTFRLLHLPKYSENSGVDTFARFERELAFRDRYRNGMLFLREEIDPKGSKLLSASFRSKKVDKLFLILDKLIKVWSKDD